jgi:hypothetical protein
MMLIIVESTCIVETSRCATQRRDESLHVKRRRPSLRWVERRSERREESEERQSSKRSSNALLILFVAHPPALSEVWSRGSKREQVQTEEALYELSVFREHRSEALKLVPVAERGGVAILVPQAVLDETAVGRDERGSVEAEEWTMSSVVDESDGELPRLRTISLLRGTPAKHLELSLAAGEAPGQKAEQRDARIEGGILRAVMRDAL